MQFVDKNKEIEDARMMIIFLINIVKLELNNNFIVNFFFFFFFCMFMIMVYRLKCTIN